MSDNLPYVVKQVLKLYDVDTKAFVNKKHNYISITVHVIFIPKKENPLTPNKVGCYGVVNYYKKGSKLEEMILPNELVIPILSYVDDNTSFNDFVESTIRDIADKEYKRTYE
jgi:hypothetical protein